MTDKVVVITGGSRGIGRATAIAAAARGFRVVVGYASNKTAADEVVAQIEASNGKAIAVARPMPRLPPVMTTTLSVNFASIDRHAPAPVQAAAR